MKAKSTKSLCQRIMNWLYSSQGELILAVLASVLPNFAFQTKEILLNILMPLQSLRQLFFFMITQMWLNSSFP